MNLRDYLHVYNITTIELQEKTFFSKTHIRGYLHGRVKASHRFAKTVEKVTNGKCSYDEIKNWTGYTPPDE